MLVTVRVCELGKCHPVSFVVVYNYLQKLCLIDFESILLCSDFYVVFISHLCMSLIRNLFGLKQISYSSEVVSFVQCCACPDISE